MTGNRFEKLMHYVCVGHGYCGSIVDGEPLHVHDFIPNSGLVTSEQFAEWVMVADGCGPDSPLKFRKKHKTSIKNAFLKYMGADTVDASELKYAAEN